MIFNNAYVLISKIFIQSSAFTFTELSFALNKLVNVKLLLCSKEQKFLTDLITIGTYSTLSQSEKFHVTKDRLLDLTNDVDAADFQINNLSEVAR